MPLFRSKRAGKSKNFDSAGGGDFLKFCERRYKINSSGWVVDCVNLSSKIQVLIDPQIKKRPAHVTIKDVQSLFPKQQQWWPLGKLPVSEGGLQAA